MADLTTLAAVREFTQKPANVSVDQDALLSSLITRASVMLQNALGRELAPTNGTTRTFPYLGSGMVETGDLRHVTAVSYDTDSLSPATLTTAAGSFARRTRRAASTSGYGSPTTRAAQATGTSASASPATGDSLPRRPTLSMAAS
jgi:hypothetical protein